MSFPRYPKYKDSGVEWVGRIPQHWAVQPFYGSVAECDESNEGMIEENLLSLSYGRIVRKDISANDGLLPESFETYQIVRSGDIVLRLTDLQNDKRSLRSALVEEVGIITSAYLAVRPHGGQDSRFMNYLLRAYDVAKVFYSMGGGLRQAMTFDDLKRLPMVQPPLPEQIVIATFLDRETSKIDALVAEQRRLMELLREERQTVISHAVTNGIAAGVPMRASGHEWFQEVPTTWQSGPLKHFWEVVDCKHVTVPFSDDGFRIASVMEVRSFELDLSEALRTSAVFYEQLIDGGRRPMKGDVIYCRNTANTGTSAYVGTDEPIALGQDVCLIKSRTQNGRYLNYVLHSSFMAAQLRSLMVGSTFKRINVENIRQLAVPCPPKNEQDAIAKFLDLHVAKLDHLIDAASKTIDLLLERRTGLIFAAVTGEFDVRQVESERTAA